tara:strand:+ start:789 stop:1007 length:219 start_codon:yes stop_codon:yes gene_type:complete
MAHVHWEIKKGDLVKISSSTGESGGSSYGVVISKEPYTDQISLFPAVMVYSFLDGCEHQFYPYNLEIVSSAA